MKRIINGFEVDWASECVFAEQQTAPNYGYLFEVSADRKRIVRCAHVSAISACSDAESIFGGVVRVSVLVAPLGVLLVVHMPTDRPRDQNDAYADDQRSSYQLFHFHPHRAYPVRA